MPEHGSSSYQILVMDQRPSTIPAAQYAENAHSEIEVETAREALIYLHALAGKSRPEWAVANIGDSRGWVTNEHLDRQRLDAALVHAIDRLIAREEASDAAAEVEDNEYLPDITVRPFAEGLATVTSRAMDCELITREVPRTVAELIAEYRERVTAGEVSRPCYDPPPPPRRSAHRPGQTPCR